MIDFRLTVHASREPAEDLVFGPLELAGFRLHERVSGVAPDLDRPAAELGGLEAPSLFGAAGSEHAPRLKAGAEPVSPPYYLRALVTPRLDLGRRLGEPLRLVGRPALLDLTFGVAGRDVRRVRGLVARVERRLGAEDALELLIHPWPWMMVLSDKARVWRNQTSLDVLRALIAQYGAELGDQPALHTAALRSALPVRPYAIQWKESDFAFVNRLLERDGVFYVFHHEADRTLIRLADLHGGLGDHPDLPVPDLALRSQPPSGAELFDDVALGVSQAVRALPRRVQVADYNPLNAEAGLDYGNPGDLSTALSIYDYPAEVDSLGEAPELARRRLSALQVERDVWRVSTRSPFLAAGHSVLVPDGESLAREPRPLRVLQTVMELTRDALGRPLFRSWFTGTEAQARFAPLPLTPVPAIHGTHNARVVSELPGEEVDVDQHGRALVAFRWDPNQSAIRVRLGQPWAGSAHGLHLLPRAGDEVLVGFIQGAVDRPVILTGVHNSTNPKLLNPVKGSDFSIPGSILYGERANRYAAAWHTPEGSMLYMGSEPGRELVKLDAWRDMELEIGHVTEPPRHHARWLDDTPAADLIGDGGRTPLFVLPGSLMALSGAAPPPGIWIDGATQRYFGAFKSRPEAAVQTAGPADTLAALAGQIRARLGHPPGLYLSRGTTGTATDPHFIIGDPFCRQEFEHRPITGGGPALWTRSRIPPPGHEPVIVGTPQFENHKSARGTGTLRAYGDLNINVGKGSATFSDGAPETAETPLLPQDRRGDLNLYVWGEHKRSASSSFQVLRDPCAHEFLEVEYAWTAAGGPYSSGRSRFLRGATAEGRTGKTAEFISGAALSYRSAFQAEIRSARLETEESIHVTNNVSGFHIDGAGQTFKHTFGWWESELVRDVTAVSTSYTSGALATSAQQTARKAFGLVVKGANTALNKTLMLLTMSVTMYADLVSYGLHAAGIRLPVVGKKPTGTSQLNEEALKEYLQTHMQRIGDTTRRIAGFIYIGNMAVALIHMLASKLSTVDPSQSSSNHMPGVTSVESGLIGGQTLTGAAVGSASQIAQATGNVAANMGAPANSQVPPPAPPTNPGTLMKVWKLVKAGGAAAVSTYGWVSAMDKAGRQ